MFMSINKNKVLLIMQISISLGVLYAGYNSFLLNEKVYNTKKDLIPTIKVMSEVASQRDKMDEFSKPLPAGRTAPYFSLKDETGTNISLEYYKGQKVLLVFSSIYECSNCSQVFEAIKELQIKKPEIQLLFLMHESSPEQNFNYKLKNNVQSKMLNSSIVDAENYHIDSIPTSVLIDEQGKIVKTFRALKLIDFEKNLK